jgi:predicted lipid-binding transport protein (Tim44 family)
LTGLGVLVAAVLGTSCGGSDGEESAAAKLATWCPQANKIQDAGTAMAAALSASPDALKQQLDELTTTIEQARKTAPGEIADDAATVSETYTKIVGVFVKNDYKATAILTDPTVTAAINDADFTAALGNITQYVETHCTATTTVASATSTTAVATTT